MRANKKIITYMSLKKKYIFCSKTDGEYTYGYAKVCIITHGAMFIT